jgi:integrase/recombinase XerD
MLERYFMLPKTIDRIRSSWLADPIEQYVAWLTERRFTAASIVRRVPVILRFAEFAWSRGARRVRELAKHLDSFVRRRLRCRMRPCCSAKAKQAFIAEIKGPIEQLLRIVLPKSAVPATEPFVRWAPGLFAYLREERGLRDETLRLYRHHMVRFEDYVTKRGVRRPKALTPAVLDGFIVEMRKHHCPRALHGVCTALRALLRYLFRVGLTSSDLSAVVDGPRIYQLAEIPRSIAWDDVMKTLSCIDRRSALGKRDYAILLLLAVYGLRAREVAALTLDDIQWRAEALHIRGRKAGHATDYPLARQVGDAIVDYLKHGRPATTDRRIFLVIRAPRGPITGRIVACQARRYLRAAGIQAPRLGSHTLRHSVAQRLVDADFSLKVVGDYLGHRSPSSSRIYGKVAIESLRELALGDGEAIL